ncbi:porin family protein [Vibrio sp. 16]|uniref:porin family protein n=1 Tax=Vibrio sp. 16 TaxID=391586 RepID=UPI002ACBEFAF|nr:porin family protein [Vibrio sp. 16]CAK4075460.1 Outer membrane protein A [Vibrio sp. 16]
MGKALLLTALFSGFASAHGFDGFYLGAGLGSTDFDDGGVFNDDELPLSTDTKGSTVKLIAGYQINRVLGVEAQYTRYGETSVQIAEQKAADIKHRSFTISASLGHSFDNGVRPFATLGIGSIEYTLKNRIYPQESRDESGSTVRLGAGLEYTPYVVKGFTIRASYEADYFVLEDKWANRDYDQSMGSWYLGTTYKF